MAELWAEINLKTCARMNQLKALITRRLLIIAATSTLALAAQSSGVDGKISQNQKQPNYPIKFRFHLVEVFHLARHFNANTLGQPLGSRVDHKTAEKRLPPVNCASKSLRRDPIRASTPRTNAALHRVAVI